MEPWTDVSGAGISIREVSLDRSLDAKQTEGILAPSNDGIAEVQLNAGDDHLTRGDSRRRRGEVTSD